jgi:hypothetical protein
LGIKRQALIGVHVSAQIIRVTDGELLKFSAHSAFAVKVLKLPRGRQVHLPGHFFDVFHRFLSNRH